MERLEAYDLALLYRLTRYRAPWWEQTLIAVTQLGYHLVLVAVVVLAAGLVLAMRRRRLAGLMVLIALLGWAIEIGVKYTVQRPRPNLAAALTEPPRTPSFPSGHASATMTIYGSLGVFLGRTWPRWSKAF